MITVSVNDRSFVQAMNKLKKAGGDPSTYLPTIAESLKNSTKLRFVTSTSPEGKAWAPVRRKGSPLRDTGQHLMNAVNTRVGSNYIQIGVPYKWGAVHQFGATIRAKNVPFLRFKINGKWISKKQVTIPARPFLGISLADRVEIKRILGTTFAPTP